VPPSGEVVGVPNWHDMSDAGQHWRHPRRARWARGRSRRCSPSAQRSPKLRAEVAGHEPRPAFVEIGSGMLKAGSPLTASLLRDIEGRSPIESEHVLGRHGGTGEEDGHPASPY
jgi:hypothetical protein